MSDRVTNRSDTFSVNKRHGRWDPLPIPVWSQSPSLCLVDRTLPSLVMNSRPLWSREVPVGSVSLVRPDPGVFRPDVERSSPQCPSVVDVTFRKTTSVNRSLPDPRNSSHSGGGSPSTFISNLLESDPHTKLSNLISDRELRNPDPPPQKHNSVSVVPTTGNHPPMVSTIQRPYRSCQDGFLERWGLRSS